MENSNSVNIYVYALKKNDGRYIYSLPFSATSDKAAITLIAHTLGTYKFNYHDDYQVSNIYKVATIDYVSSFEVSDTSMHDFLVLYKPDEMLFDVSELQSLINELYDNLCILSNKEEVKTNA